MKTLPSARWLLSSYVRDVWSRLQSLVPAVTCIYGCILKIDSTKEVCKKLQSLDAKSASWATNVGNERREIVQCVITETELESLHKMADGLVRRYENAPVQQRLLLYTDRDCCTSDESSKLNCLSLSGTN